MSDRCGSLTDTGSDYSGQYNQPPYSEIAEIYDRLMDHVDYVSWAEYISSVFQHFRVKVKNIFEIACGTGNLSVEIHKLGYSITGMDVSAYMLAKAAQKFRKCNIPVRLFSSTMTSIPLSCHFDAVLCIYDSINYLKTHENFVQTVSEAAKVTRTGGLFIFDVCTVKNSEMFFSNRTMVENIGGVSYERICSFNKTDGIQKNQFIIKKNGICYVESHYQKIYKLEEIRAMINNTPFRVLGLYDDLSFMPGSENSVRVHFILQKK